MTNPAKRLRVLIVEDFDDTRELYRELLEHEGYEVTEARDGGEGLALAREGLPDLIVLDLSMPVLSGWEVARILREEPGTSAIPIIACTAHVHRPEHDRARAAGCMAVLVKPVPLPLLVQLVRESIGNGLAGASLARPGDRDCEDRCG